MQNVHEIFKNKVDTLMAFTENFPLGKLPHLCWNSSSALKWHQILWFSFSNVEADTFTASKRDHTSATLFMSIWDLGWTGFQRL